MAVGLLLISAALPGQGCETLEPPAPGSLALVIAWDEEPTEPVWIWARVEERADPSVPGDILASAGPVEWESGAVSNLDLSGVDNGDDRVVVIEVREGPSTTLRVLWFGISEPFSIEAGTTRTVEAPLTLQTPESTLGAVSFTLELDSEAPGVGDAEAVRDIRLIVHSEGAEQLRLANDPTFSAGFTELALAAGGALEGLEGSCEDVPERSGSIQCTVAGWDLTEGLPVVEDGPMTVYAKLVDALGYESEVLTATVVRDTMGPNAVIAAFSDPVIAPTQDLTLDVSADEGVRVDLSTLELVPEGGRTSRSAGSRRPAPSPWRVRRRTAGSSTSPAPRRRPPGALGPRSGTRWATSRPPRSSSTGRASPSSSLWTAPPPPSREAPPRSRRR